MKILIVDDSPTVRAVINMLLLEDDEFEIVGEAENGLRGVDLAVQLQPDLVLLDVHMPGMDGLIALRRILTQIDTRVVMLTADRSDKTERKAKFYGALTVLPKPSMDWKETASETFRSVLKLYGKTPLK